MKKKYIFRRIVGAISYLNFRRIEECATLIRWLDSQGGERILDIGCGDGYYDMLITLPGASVVGIDINKKPLKKAQRLYTGEQFEFLYMNAEELEFSDASFDKVVSFCVIEHLNQDDRAMQHISRVLKPGGSFVFSADSLSNHGITAEERKNHKLRYAVNTFYTIEYLNEKLARAGFTIEEAKYILDTPYALALARFSWKLDVLPKALGVVKTLGYMSLWILWKLTSPFANHSGTFQGGLTLLVHAKKTPHNNAVLSISPNGFGV
jgi:2-polyprenyl-3-methyl-5-hydroxy-6-metoxy-1,4-benzoquinol methylase